MCTEQNVTVGVPESEGRRSRPRTVSRTIHHVLFACGVFLEGKHHGVRLKGVLVEQESEVRVVSVRNELIGDVRNMITGFLKNNRMELSKSSRDNVGGVPAGQSWIPLKNRETVLMLHEIAVNSINVSEPVRFDHGEDRAGGFGTGQRPARGSAPMARRVPARAVLALPL